MLFFFFKSRYKDAMTFSSNIWKNKTKQQTKKQNKPIATFDILWAFAV